MNGLSLGDRDSKYDLVTQIYLLKSSLGNAQYQILNLLGRLGVTAEAAEAAGAVDITMYHSADGKLDQRVSDLHLYQMTDRAFHTGIAELRAEETSVVVNGKLTCWALIKPSGYAGGKLWLEVSDLMNARKAAGEYTPEIKENNWVKLDGIADPLAHLRQMMLVPDRREKSQIVFENWKREIITDLPLPTEETQAFIARICS